MSRGGYRPGSGRPKGAKSKQAPDETGFPSDVVKAAATADMSPLDYMLMVMRNQDADQSRRDRMAVAAAPFCHPRIADNRFGKKDQAEAEAEAAATDSRWASVLARAN